MAAALEDSTLLTATDWAFRIRIEDKPYDIMDTDAGHFGIPHYATPYPPSGTVNQWAFTLEDKPIVLEEGKNLKISVVNISGSDYTVPTGKTFTAKVLIVGTKESLS